MPYLSMISGKVIGERSLEHTHTHANNQKKLPEECQQLFILHGVFPSLQHVEIVVLL